MVDVIRSFYHSYSNNCDRRQHQPYLSESSYSFTDPDYLRNQGSNLDTILKTEVKELPKSPFINNTPLICCNDAC